MAATSTHLHSQLNCDLKPGPCQLCTAHQQMT